MSQLDTQLRSAGILDDAALDAAMRRQQIYGGSLDTVLLELELLDPATLAAQLALANDCDNLPVLLLQPGPERPWDALPPGLVELGWVMPVRRHMGRVQVVVHPEITPDQRARVEADVAHVQVMVSCEAGLAKLAAERRGSVVPQRYAILALRWIQALREPEPTPESPGSAPGSGPVPSGGPEPAAPWMVAATGTAPFSVPSPNILPVAAKPKPAAEPRASNSGSRNQTFLYGLPVDDDDELPPLGDDDGTPDPAPSSAAATPSTSSPAATPSVSSPAASALSSSSSGLPGGITDDEPGLTLDPPVPNSDPESEDAPAPRRVHERGAEPRPSASIRGRLVEPLRILQAASRRDEATEALARAAMVLSPRVALFGVKHEGLRGLATPGEIPRVEDQLVGLSRAIEAAVEGQTTIESADDLDLRIAVSQEVAVPCLFLPVQVHGRAVLMLYVDRNGERFSAAELEAAYDLCEIAGQTLEGVLRGMRARQSSTSIPAVPAPKPAVPKPAPAARASVPDVPTTRPSFQAPGSRPHPVSRPGASAPAKPAQPPATTATTATATATATARLPAQGAGAVEPRPAPTPSRQPPVGAKPPVRLRRTAGTSVGTGTSPSSGPSSGPADSGSMRGRIQLDEEDQAARPDTAARATLDSAISAATHGGATELQQLRDLGEPARLRIAELFPGDLDVQRRDLDALPPLPAHGPLIRVTLDLGHEMGAHLVGIIGHPNPAVRFYVAFTFMELRHERAPAVLGERAFDPDADVRAIAMRVLETYSGEAGFNESIGTIRRELDSPNRTRQLHAARAVGTVRDIQSVAKLIELLASKERYIQEAALESLCSITGQQLGLKPHRWRSWYADNAHHHRIEWIISSLAHKDISVRRWAADELRRITGQRINFLAAGSRQEREIGIKKWVEWWHGGGRDEFV